VGVWISYKYSWVTPLPSLIGLSGTFITFDEINIVQMEPIPVS